MYVYICDYVCMFICIDVHVRNTDMHMYVYTCIYA